MPDYAFNNTFMQNEVEILQNGDIHLAQIPDLEMGYIISRTIWHTEVSDGSFFAFLPSFIWAQVIFYQSFPLIVHI